MVTVPCCSLCAASTIYHYVLIVLLALLINLCRAVARFTAQGLPRRRPRHPAGAPWEVVSLAERPQLHSTAGLIPRDVDACRAIVAEQTESALRACDGQRILELFCDHAHLTYSRGGAPF